LTQRVLANQALPDAIALRPRSSACSMISRYGSQALIDRLSRGSESVVTPLVGFGKSGSMVTSLAGFGDSESVVTSLAGFAGSRRLQTPGWRTPMPGISQQAYERITYGITIATAQTLVRLNPEMTFIYVSGQSTDGTEQGRIMWARIKGKTENAISRLPFAPTYMFRPGIIQPLHGITSKTVPIEFCMR
jgi:hypothetical protein